MWKRKTSQSAQHGVERPVLRPFVEEIPRRRPRTIFAGQVSPRRAGPQDPENGVENYATVARATARLEISGRKEVSHRFPLRIG